MSDWKFMREWAKQVKKENDKRMRMPCPRCGALWGGHVALPKPCPLLPEMKD
jgi:hypothetical protein